MLSARMDLSAGDGRGRSEAGLWSALVAGPDGAPEWGRLQNRSQDRRPRHAAPQSTAYFIRVDVPG